jgi:hypothetical protein
MKWAVQLTGLESTFEMLAPCFQSDYLRIVKREVWFLESERLNQCVDANAAWAVAEKLLTQLETTAYLFAGYGRSFEIGYAQSYKDDGTLGPRGLRGTATINVVSAVGTEELKFNRVDSTLGSYVAYRVTQDPDIQAAFSLIATEEVNWHQIYDIIEFIGPTVIGKKKWASIKEVRIIKQTANHYRHLGRPKKNPLPPNPPTVHQARARALAFLKLWLLERL